MVEELRFNCFLWSMGLKTYAKYSPLLFSVTSCFVKFFLSFSMSLHAQTSVRFFPCATKNIQDNKTKINICESGNVNQIRTLTVIG